MMLVALLSQLIIGGLGLMFLAVLGVIVKCVIR